MPKVLFVSGDIGGNVPPTRAIARELARRGHEVMIAGLRVRDGSSAERGVELLPLPSLSAMDVTRAPGPLGHLPALSRMALGRSVGREVRSAIAARAPDAIVVDALMLGSLREALRSGIPTAALFHSLGAFWSKGLQNPVANTVLRPAGLAPLALLQRADALLLPTDPDLDPAHPSGSRIAFDWLGTTEPGATRAPRQASRQRVLVSLSSAWQRGQGAVYDRILQALAPLPVDVTVTTGGVQLERELVPPPNAEVHARIRHEEIMPSIDLVIGHGGHSTTLKALAHGIPLLLLPLDPTSDQPLIGRTIEAAGLGRSVPRSSRPEIIRSAAVAILGDAAMVAAADHAGQRLRGQHGAEAGADRVEGIIRHR